MKLGCNVLKLLPDNAYAGCGGHYALAYGEHVAWEPLLPVYKHIENERYIFYAGNGYGKGWACGKKEGLSSGAHFINSKYQSYFKEWEDRVANYTILSFVCQT